MKTISFFPLIIVLLFWVSSSSCSQQKNDDTSDYIIVEDEYYMEEYVETGMDVDDGVIKVAYKESAGSIVTIPVQINGIGLDMIFDTGASTTCITLAEANYMYQKGDITSDDIRDQQFYQTADGDISVGLRINIRKLSIGDEITLHDVEALVVQNQEAPLLLGQSVMKKFREVSIDRENKIIKFFE